MRKIGLIPYDFGAAASSAITKGAMQFYQWIADTITGDKCEIFSKHSAVSIAVNQTESLTIPGAAYNKFLKRLESWAEVKIDVGIVDIDVLDSLIPGPTEFQIAQAIIYCLSGAKQANYPDSFIFLMRQLPPHTESIYRILEPFITEGNVIVIDKSGKYISSNNIEFKLDKNQYKGKRSKARENPLEMLNKKMIRRPGHFMRRPENEENTSCIRFSYDGSECEDELANLIHSFVINEYQKPPSHILYYREFSSWLKQPVIASAKKVDAEFMHIRDFLDVVESFDSNELIPPLLVFPLVDTGKTIERLLHKWEKACHGDLPSPKILIIMIGDRALEKVVTQGEIVIETPTKQYPASYFMEVGRGAILQTNCPQCKLGIPYTDLKQEEFAEITTFDMWDLADTAGWIEEDNIPENRSGLAKVPNIPQLVEKNGAWLAYKFRELIIKYYNIENFIAKPILIVCPDEDGATALAKYIQVIQGFTIVTIPKQVINKCCDENADFDMLVKDWGNEEWFRQLNSASNFQPIMILEEFIVTGGTRTALYGLLTFLEKEVLCHFSLVDFSYKVNSLKDTLLPSCSLYKVKTTKENYITP